MSGTNLVEDTGDPQNPKNLVRSQYKDIMVKVDEDVYYLDRLQLALESEYFEKLFIEDYADRNCELIELPVLDTDTFYAIVDIIYGAKLESVVDSDNYISLLMAMDYLQMEIDPKTYSLLGRKLLCDSPLNLDIFRLYHFTAGNSNYEYLLPIIFEHLSNNSRQVRDLDELLPIPFHHFSQIRLVSDCELNWARTCSRICAKWISHDMENRLPHLMNLVNSVKSRSELSFYFDHENLSIPLPTVNEHLNQDTIKKYIFKLLLYNGEISNNTKTGVQEPERCAKSDESDSENQLVSKCTRESKLQKFLEDEIFCDIVVKAGEKRYKLHRSVLKSASEYFEEIFSAECTEILAKCEGIPVLPSMDKEYFLDEIDQTTFDIIIDHIYSKEVEFSADIIVRLFKAADLLKIDDLLEQCESWMMDNSEDVCAQDVIEIINFTHENVEYKNLNRFYLSKYITDSWPEIGNLPQFADLFKEITVPEGTSSRSDENEVYLFNNVDQETFRFIINYIYRDELDLKEDNVVRVLKASEIFKMKELMEECIDELTECCWEFDSNSDDLIEVLRFAFRNTNDDLIAIYSVEHIRQWPEVDNLLFCSFSYEALENILMSPDLYFNDPYRILDICSKWITQDMKNRYHLVPQIALAISRNGLVNCDDYTIESPPNLENCSQDFVKDKLLEILSTTCVVPSIVSSNFEKFNTDELIFITSKKDGSFSILNSNLDEITSLHVYRYLEQFSKVSHPMSATMINDNLFLICSIDDKPSFHGYNFPSKKSFSLALDSRFKAKNGYYDYDSAGKDVNTLLNCCNEIYCCIEDGAVLKYSFELNRWSLFSEAEPDKDGVRFTSDGNNLYRMFRVSPTEHTMNYVMETYNVEQNSWISLPNVPILSHDQSYADKTKYKLIFMNDYGFAVLFQKVLYILGQDAEWWRTMPSLPYRYIDRFIKHHAIITQDKSGELLYMLDNELHRFSRSHQRWQLKKKLPIIDHNYYYDSLPFENIIAIHKPVTQHT